MNNEPNLSVYGDGTGEDFPVLKAFQQYIDAEQAKARRRLLTVSIIFVVMLLSVVAIFSALVIRANNQTQTLNDRLVEFAMKNPGRNYEEAKAAALQELNVKSLNETVSKLQKQIEEQERKASEAAANAARELAAAKESAAAAAASPAVDKRAQYAEAKLARALEQLRIERQKLADDKAKLRQEELEKYRREHYPEYYAKREAAKAVRTVTRQRPVPEDDEMESVTYFDEADDYESATKPARPAAKPSVKPTAKPAAKPAAEKSKPAAKEIDLESDEGAIEYFKESDSYTIPVEVKGKRAGWRVPLD